MAAWRRFLARLRNALRPEAAEQELARELAAHLALLEDDFRKTGASPEEAHAAAMHALGGVERAKDLHRDERSFAWLDDARQDIRYTLRSLARSPGFAVVVVGMMALGVGATTTLFSFAYGVLLRPLPWPEPDRLVRVEEQRGGNSGRIPWTISNAMYLAWRDNRSTVEDIGGWVQIRDQTMTIAGSGEADRVAVGPVTPSLFPLLRARPELGRLFVDADADPGSGRSIILGYGLWQRAFGGRVDVVGQIVRLDGNPFTIVGVMPRGFAFPDGQVQAWIPLYVVSVYGAANVQRAMIFSALVRLRPGATAAQAAAEATARSRDAEDLGRTALALFGSNGEVAIATSPARDVLTAEVRPALTVLLAAVGLLFVTATASVVIVQLARSARRQRETAVRAALGAGNARLTRQWLAESILLGLAGGAAGFGLSATLHQVVPRVLPADFPRLDAVRLDAQVALFAVAVTLGASIVCGLAPALAARRRSLVDLLAQDSASPAGGTTRAAAVRTAIMAAQVAIACVLLVGATLLGRSFVELLTADRGYDPRSLLTARIPLPPKSTFEQRAPLLEALSERLQALPGVTQVAFGNALPFVTTGGFSGLNIPSPQDPGVKIEVQTMTRAVSPSYFEAMRLRVRVGRPLTDADTATSQPVVVVNRSFASRYLGDDAVGQRLVLGTFGVNGRTDREVVGVVDDMRQGGVAAGSTLFGGVDDPPQPEMFFPHRQWQIPVPELMLAVRSDGDPASLAPTLRAIVRSEDPSLALDSVMTMDERVMASLAMPRTYAILLVGLAIFALTIAGVGLFGVLSYTTAQRTREIGVRTALGATPRDVVGLVVRQAMASVAAGLVAGLLAAFVLVEWLASLLYGVSARDAMTFVAVPLLLVLVALVACAVPARRAARIDPLVALRSL